MKNEMFLRMTALYAPTLKEDPADAEIASHRLLVRAGMIRKVASGIYTFLPLGMRVLAKVEAIVREEMDAAGAQEMLMSVLQPSELWHESGRWDAYGPELMRLQDRHDHQFCLGPTHEELITSLVRNELRSYKELPLTQYQIQVKFRDEIRPRFGLMRSREFIMKDAYSFHASQESLQQTYDEMSRAYARICERMNMEYRAVEADPGQIGGSITREFMALAEAGEAEIVHCSCGYAANTEVGVCLTAPTEYAASGLERIATPGVQSIAELAEFLQAPASSTVKALAGKNDQGEIVLMFIAGDHELNDLKAARVAGGFTLLDDNELQKNKLHKGYLGPRGLPEGIRVIADNNLKAISQWVVGANEPGFHYVGARPGVDFQVDEWADVCTVRAGDSCPQCGLALQSARGIEVSQVFQLGDKYSRPMGATFMAEDGSQQPFLMGCYGVGISRIIAAIVEQHNDEQGISWPMSVAPAQVCVIPLTVNDEVVQPAAEKLAGDLAKLGLQVVIDDRKERAGVKFADADLIGWPLQVVMGKRGLAEQKVEIKARQSGARRDISLTALTDVLAFAQRNTAKWSPELDIFGSLFE